MTELLDRAATIDFRTFAVEFARLVMLGYGRIQSRSDARGYTIRKRGGQYAICYSGEIIQGYSEPQIAYDVARRTPLGSLFVTAYDLRSVAV